MTSSTCGEWESGLYAEKVSWNDVVNISSSGFLLISLKETLPLKGNITSLNTSPLLCHLASESGEPYSFVFSSNEKWIPSSSS